MHVKKLLFYIAFYPHYIFDQANFKPGIWKHQTANF